MQVIRGTRAPFLAAACALLMIGAGTADGVEPGPVYPTFYYVQVAGGVDGCPAVAGSTFDPRKLCGADLGIGWRPVGARDLHLCPPGPAVFDAVLTSGPITVSEDIMAKPTPAWAVASVLIAAEGDCPAASIFAGPPRELPATAIAGTSAEAQSMRTFPRSGAAIATVMAIGNVVVAVAVSDDDGVPDNATVLRIVDAAVHRFRNPRPSGGPFPLIMTPAPVASPAP
jgi:hypothetical protein